MSLVRFVCVASPTTTTTTLSRYFFVRFSFDINFIKFIREKKRKKWLFVALTNESIYDKMPNPHLANDLSTHSGDDDDDDDDGGQLIRFVLSTEQLYWLWESYANAVYLSNVFFSFSFSSSSSTKFSPFSNSQKSQIRTDCVKGIEINNVHQMRI